MNITIQLNGDETGTQLDAIGALIDVLAGRGPRTEIRAGQISVSGSEQFVREHIDVPAEQRVRTPGDDEGEPRNTDTSELDADVIDAAVAAGAPERDSAGLPWDARIHSASRATVADGTWRRRKNTSDDLFESVMAELRAAHPTATDVRPPPPPTTDTIVPEPVVTVPEAAGATSADSDVPPPPAATDGPDLSTFAKFVQSVMDKDVPAVAKTYAALGKLCAESFDCAALKDMKDKSGQWALFYDMVG